MQQYTAQQKTKHLSDFQEGPISTKRRGFLRSYKCVAVVVIVVILLGAICACIVSVVLDNHVPPEENEVPNYNFPFVTRAQWNARRPKGVETLVTPVPFVIIHHSYIPGSCHNSDQCTQAMRSMQNYHMDDQGWLDIGYNFAVGSNGKAYEGRGWRTLGAHALSYNRVSIGICLIGDWSINLPPAEQMKTAQMLIEAGVALGFIDPEYKLVGHRQVGYTECPGEALFKEIKNWDNFFPYPNSFNERVNIKNIQTSVKEELKTNSTNDNRD